MTLKKENGNYRTRGNCTENLLVLSIVNVGMIKLVVLGGDGCMLLVGLGALRAVREWTGEKGTAGRLGTVTIDQKVTNTTLTFSRFDHVPHDRWDCSLLALKGL